MVAEALARGIVKIVLIDFDSVKEHNLDRLLHASIHNVRLADAKVESLARGLRRSATAAAPSIEALPYSVVEPAGWAVALDCDVIFSSSTGLAARSVEPRRLQPSDPGHRRRDHSHHHQPQATRR